MRARAAGYRGIFVAGLVGVLAIGIVLVVRAAGTDLLGRVRPNENAKLAQAASDVVPARPNANETVVTKDPILKPAPRPAVQGKTPAETEEPEPAESSQLRGLTDIPLLNPETAPDTGANDRSSAPPTSKGSRPNVFDPNAKGREVLPWDMVEPVTFPPTGSVAESKEPTVKGAGEGTPPTPAPFALPESRAVETWMKVKATEVTGQDRARPLTHFEVWLEPPEHVANHLTSVTYAFSTPAVQPQKQTSSDAASGFRIRLGALTCADTITLTMSFDDGRSNEVAVDGCRLFAAGVE